MAKNKDTNRIPTIFTEEEYKQLENIREFSGNNWHDFILEIAKSWIDSEYDAMNPLKG